MTPPKAGREVESRRTRLVMLEAEARYARDRYRLYGARLSGPRPVRPGRLRELEREHRRAESRLRRARSGETRLLAALNTAEREPVSGPQDAQPQ